jgi:hypothetical protein
MCQGRERQAGRATDERVLAPASLGLSVQVDSRNRFIVRTLEKELADHAHWSPGFFERLADVRVEDVAAVKDLEASIRACPPARRNPGEAAGRARFQGSWP